MMKMRQDTPRSNCPINYSLGLVGDKWSLLIIRDMVYFGKKTYGEFISSDEGIARNILASRLVQLVEGGLIMKMPYQDDGRKDIYKLTEKGMGLIPTLLELADWGSQHFESGAPEPWLKLVRRDRSKMIALITETVQAGGAIFAGENSVISKLSH